MSAVMLYKKGVEIVWEGLHLATKVVDDIEVEAHKALGWFTHPYDTIEVPTETDPTDVAPVEPASAAVPTETAVAQTVETVATAPVADQTVAADAALSVSAAPANPFAPKA